ncbi:MAG: acylphosphatase [Flavobacteriales bacterium]
MKKAFKIRVIGRVQGVWFRKYTKQKADELAISGFVRNERDGSVYMEAEGEAAAMDEFIQWCYVGSPESKVAQVIASEIQSKNWAGFQIQR